MTNARPTTPLFVAVPFLVLVAAACGAKTAADPDTATPTPQANTTTSPAPAMFEIDACVHNDLSKWECPDTSDNITRVATADVASVVVTVVLKNGKELKSVFPANVDAVVMSKFAAENFFVPYYEKKDPPDAAKLRARIATMWP